MDRGEVGERTGRERTIELAQRPRGWQAAGALDLGAFELASQVGFETAQRVARKPVASRVLGRQLWLGLGAQPQRAPDALHVDPDHARPVLALPERRDRHARQVAHRALRALAQRGRDLRAQLGELRVAELVQVGVAGAGAGRALFAHALPDGGQLDGAEEEAIEHQRERAPVLLALRERRRERLAEVFLRGPADLAQHVEGVEQLRGADRDAFSAQLLAELQQLAGEAGLRGGAAAVRAGRLLRRGHPRGRRASSRRAHRRRPCRFGA